MSQSFRYGAQPKYYPVNWAGRGHPGNRAATTRALGELDWDEAGGGLPWPPLGHDTVNEAALYNLEPLVLPPGNPLSGWPLYRPSGVEPLGMSNSERKYLLVAGAAVAVWYFVIKKKKRR